MHDYTSFAPLTLDYLVCYEISVKGDSNPKDERPRGLICPYHLSSIFVAAEFGL